ncbi:2'-5' RNA ligase family protein [Rothia uropygialis]|uniref:2'-5' RNA ligase family protein n=1 Tax=Kocuria sp. 36 TaxID=1415402 RepID=UPI00101DA8BE|nr:2'-5' RNA ligase family protein [Kocuria sp. 36]
MVSTSDVNNGKISVSPTILPGHSYLSLVLDVPLQVHEDVIRWRSEHCTGTGVPLHITIFIAELGENPEEEATGFLSELREKCRGLAPGNLTLSGTGTFRPMSDVVFLSVGEGEDFLTDLHERCLSLRQSASPFLYHPHMTLTQNENRSTLEAALADFRDYRVTFPLRGMDAYIGEVSGWRPLGRINFG